MASFKIFIFVAFVVLTILDLSLGKEFSFKRPDPNHQNPLLGQLGNKAFYDYGGYGFGADEAESLKDISELDKSPNGGPLAEYDGANIPSVCSSVQCDDQCAKNLCLACTTNRTIHLGCGRTIVCVVPTDEELLKKLKEIGGYNRHYVATSMAEAEKNFDDLLSPYIGDMTHPLCRRRKIFGSRNQRKPFWCRNGRKRFKRAESCSQPRCLQAGQQLRSRRGNKLACSLCQKCTELPKDVYPRVLNEIVCGSASSTYADPPRSCHFKGMKFGSCSQRNMTIDVLTKTAENLEVSANGKTTTFKQVWTSSTREIRTCCECMDS